MDVFPVNRRSEFVFQERLPIYGLPDVYPLWAVSRDW